MPNKYCTWLNICLLTTVLHAVDRLSVYQHMISDLRCPECPAQALADSQTPGAIALRQVIADKLDQGESQAKILTDLKAIYGPQISRTPVIAAETALLWGVPCLGIFSMAILMLRERRRAWLSKQRKNTQTAFECD